MKKIFILGSTGSVGVNVIKVIRCYPKEFEIVGISANSNHTKLVEQAKEFHIPTIAIKEDVGYKQLAKELKNSNLYQGEKGINDAIKKTKFDLLFNCTSGFSGLVPTIIAIKKKKDIALANKETLVAAGHIVMRLAKKNKTNIIPVDSEHSAIFHILKGLKKEEINKIILTASGGSLFNKKIKNPSIKEVLKHPTWSMGSKITVDSATMMNKGLEVIEAHYLFDMPYEKIDIIVHPESIIHSMVESVDGEVYAQISNTDMRFPIQNALTFPNLKQTKLEKIDFGKIKKMTFYPPDYKRFPLIKLAYDCGKKGGSMLTVMNASNEVAVNAFLKGKIKYNDIYKIVRKATATHKNISNPSLKEIIDIDKKTREQINILI